MKKMFTALFVGLFVLALSSQAQEVNPKPRFTGVKPAPQKKMRLLLVTDSKGFVHSVVNRNKQPLCLVEKTFLELAEKNKFFEVDYSQDARAVIDGDNLKKYDA